MDEILRLRERIDEIDQELAFLIKSRYENARLLGRIKGIRGIPVRDTERENTILRRIDRLSKQLHLDSGMMDQVFRTIFSLSVAGQSNLGTTSYQKLGGVSLLIIGGTGQMGRFLAGFASLQGARVKIAGRTIDKTRRTAKEIEVDPGTLLDSAKSDIIMISVPIEETERVAREAAPLMKKGSLLLDVSSVKTRIADRIAAHIPKSIEYVSMHPLFAPDIDQMHGQGIVAIPYRTGPKWKLLHRLFRESGANIYTMTSAEHDRKMAYVQGLHHFALIALGIALGDKGGEPRTRSLIDTEARISRIIQNWETVRSIQTLNPFVATLRRDFLRISNGLLEMRGRGVSRSRATLNSNVQKWSRKQ